MGPNEARLVSTTVLVVVALVVMRLVAAAITILGYGTLVTSSYPPLGARYCRARSTPITASTIHNQGPLKIRFTDFSRHVSAVPAT